MSVGEALFNRFQYGKITQTAGTAITQVIPPKPGYKTVVTTMWITAGATIHQVFFMRPLGSTTLTAAVTAGASYVLPVTADPGAAPKGPSGTASQLGADTAAATDYVLTSLPDGTFFLDTIASVSALNWTMTGTLPTNGAAKGATIWWFGLSSENHYLDPMAGPQMSIDTAVSVLNKWTDPDGCLVESFNANEPILVYNANATNADTHEWLAGGYIKY